VFYFIFIFYYFLNIIKKFPKSSFPITLLPARLILSLLISFRPFLLQLYLHSLTLSTPLFTLHIPQHLSRLR